MAIDRKLWLPPFTALGSWLCPSCRNGNLLEMVGQRVVQETMDSRQYYKKYGFEWDLYLGISASTLSCSKTTCNETVFAVSRVHYVSVDGSQAIDSEIEHGLTPVYVHPAPPIFLIHDAVPEAVGAALREAFALYWPNASACGNALRRAIEMIMDDRGVARFPGGDATKYPLKLHARIELFSKVSKQPAKLLMAIKWLGNSGSHGVGNQLTHEDVLEGFEFAEAALDLLYVRSFASLMERADEVNTSKGPRPRKRARAT